MNCLTVSVIGWSLVSSSEMLGWSSAVSIAPGKVAAAASCTVLVLLVLTIALY